MKKLIAIDLDGTLLNIESKISIGSKNYLHQLKNNGHIIVIATGRNLASALEVTDGASFANYIVCNAGAAIYDLIKKKVLFKETIENEVVESICSLYNDDFQYIRLNDLDNYYYMQKKDSINIKNIDVIQLTMVFKNNNQIDKMYNYISNTYKTIRSFIMQDSFSNVEYLDLTKTGCSKYNSISYIANIEKIDNENIIAFGDGSNDLEMIIKSGVGVAMENALDEVLKIADYVTLSHNDDGVIYFLKKYL